MKKTVLITLILLLHTGCSISSNEKRTNNAPVEITYWQYWTAFEGKAIEGLVDKFNKTHSNIKVKMLTISEPHKKTLLSIIGGTPPDVISSIAAWVPELSTKDALIPLDDFCKENNITEDKFIPAYWKMLNLNGHTWALPTTPTATALYWNKDMFKEAGLNPERPPKTFKELEEFSKKITKKAKNGNIKTIGFLPSWPSWSFGFYGVLFNGNWGASVGTDVARNVCTANNPNNIAGWGWAQKFATFLGPKNIQTFQEQCGNYQGPNNPFYSGKIAIELNGVWEGNFIPRYAPKMRWGVASAPSKSGLPTTIVDCDCILIPRGSKHPKEAFEFISWLLQPENIEELCTLQGKFSPLIYSDREEFIKKHPHPYIKVFIDLARSKYATYFPQSTVYELYKRELKRAFEAVMRMEKSPTNALNEVQEKMERESERQLKYEGLRIMNNG